MATYTSNYAWTKPGGNDQVDISVLNDNLDDQDRVIHNAFLNMAEPFSELSTYAVDDIVLYGTTTYKCHTAVATAGAWTGSTNWQAYKLSEGGGGGGSTLSAGDYIDITNNEINVKLQKGDYDEYEYRLLTDAVNVRLTIEKYVDGTLVDTESYLGPESYTPISIDGFFEIWYGQGGYIWRYKLLKDSQSHSAGYETGWYYTTTDEHDETFNVLDDSSNLVVKRDILSLQDKMQYSTMPTASADNEGKIYQYVGTNDANYTNGYYYKCVENSGSYSWQLVENIKEQTPTFSQASTRNNIASGEKLSVILGKIQKFFNDLKSVAFSGSYADLSNKPQINSVELSGNKTTSDLGINATNVMMPDGVTSVESAIDAVDKKIGAKKVLATATADGVKTLSAMLDELYPHRQTGAIIQVSDYAIFNTRYTTLYGCTSSDTDGNPVIRTVSLKQSGSIIKTTIPSTGTTTDQSANVPTNGTTIELYIKL